tara:strand:- start:7406 stop:10456 length:3051 start_codon:yes stop_codon:yes gene_type:complete
LKEVIDDLVIDYNFDAGPFVGLTSEKKYQCRVEFWKPNSKKHWGDLVYSANIDSLGKTAFVPTKWYIEWTIRVYKEDNLVFTHKLDLEGKKVFVRLSSNMLGDNFCWIPYVEEFRKKHNCEIFCGSTFPEIFEHTYDFEFWKEGSEWPDEEFYATYEVGVFGYKNDEPHYEFVNTHNKNSLLETSMAKTASDILGLEHKEIRANIDLSKYEPKERVKGKYVCIAPYGSAQLKMWNNEDGWQKIVDYFLNIGYKVLYLSREPNGYMNNKVPKGVIDKSGWDIPIEERIADLKYSELFLGISSGLSWVAWSVGVPVILIHGHNYSWYNPIDNVKHINLENDKSVCTGCWHRDGFAPGDWNFCPEHKGTDRQFECTKKITAEMVIEGIESMLEKNKVEVKSENRWILGVNIGHDAGATLVKDGRVFVSINLERISRIKHDEGNDDFPWAAMDYCLDYANITKKDLERVVWNGIGLQPELMMNPDGDWANRLRSNGYDLPKDRLNYCTHHLAHAYSAHYSSGFEESINIVVDAGGESNYKYVLENYTNNPIAHMKKFPLEKCVEATSIYEVKKGKFTKIYSAYKPFPMSRELWPLLGQSLGEFYAIGCNYIGMDGLYDAGKLMGLAPYGRREEALKEYEPISNVYIDDDPKAGDYFIRVHHNDVDKQMIPKSEDGYYDNPIWYINSERPKFLESNISHMDFQTKADWAWWVQHSFEKMILFLAKKASMISDVKYLTGSGGCFLNSVANQKIVDLNLFKDHFYVPASDDGGISIGTAFYGYYNFHPDKGKVNLSNREIEVFMGKEYSEEEILADLKLFDNIEYEKIEDEVELSQKVARFIHDGKVVGWFQGGSEMGPRALGHRSILGDPTHPDMQDIINDRVKHREWYRPFAPACTVEDAHRFFEHTTESPYMLLIAQVKEEYKEKLPSITHVDGSARLQTVRRETNTRYYDVIREFGRLSEIPVILNTSFNEAGEPIVERPFDAVKCSLKNNIDYLVIENFLIKKTPDVLRKPNHLPNIV